MLTHVPLPEQCMSVLVSTGELVEILKNEQCYVVSVYSTEDRRINRLIARRMNGEHGVTQAQEAAMRAGIAFGWNSEEANPENYDSNGNWIRRDKH